MLNKGIFLVSFMGNNGTFSRSRYENLTNFQLVYHVGYLMLCVLGLCLHEFFYSLLVSRWMHCFHMHRWPPLSMLAYALLFVSS